MKKKDTLLMNLNCTQYVYFCNLKINYVYLKLFIFFFYFFPQQMHQFKVDTKSGSTFIYNNIKFKYLYYLYSILYIIIF